MRHLIAPVRVFLMLLHVIDGIAISGLLFPFLSQAKRNRITRAWSRGLVRICGARLRVTGIALDPQLARDGVVPGERGRLMLCNHVSWIDVFALLGGLPVRFVAKAEIGRWPLIGQLVTLVGTLYIERGRRHAVAAMNHRVRERLQAGETIVVFAEGTTTDGTTLLPFHSNLIAPALEVGCDIWPAALRYTEQGKPTLAAAFVGEMGLVTSLWNILVAKDLEIEVAYLVPLEVTPDRTRHELAQRARTAIAEHLDIDPTLPTGAERARANASANATANDDAAPAGDAAATPPASPPADTAPGRSSARASASR